MNNSLCRSISVALCTMCVMLLLCVGRASADPADCDPVWHPLDSNGEMGTSPLIQVMTVWNGDLIVGGNFTEAGGQIVNHIARWDGETWHPFVADGEIGVSGIFSGSVVSMMVWNGDLIVGGVFETAGGQTVNGIVRWDGTQWHPLGSGEEFGVHQDVGSGHVQSGRVLALTELDGDLIVGGLFTHAGGQLANNIARWDGKAWHPFVSKDHVGIYLEFMYGPYGVRTLAVWNGDLIVGGKFYEVAGQTANHIVRWDGSLWHPFSAGEEIGVSHPVWVSLGWNDQLILGGQFTTAGDQLVNLIARWDGETWHPFIDSGKVGIQSSIVRELLLWNGDLIVGGQFYYAGDQVVRCIVRWDGAHWHTFTSGGETGMVPGVISVTAWNGDLIAGGRFDTAGGQTVNNIARWATPDAVGPADFNCDGVVNVSDLLMLLAQWGPCIPIEGSCSADLNSDGIVDVADLLILLSNWG